jgi:hypothetical protein
MFDWHIVVWIDDSGVENVSIQQDKPAALREAAALLRQGRNVIAIKRANEIVMDAAAVREHCSP